MAWLSFGFLILALLLVPEVTRAEPPPSNPRIAPARCTVGTVTASKDRNPHRRAGIVVGLIAAVSLIAGCEGSDEPATPVACREGSEAYIAALADAPGEVLLGDGTTRISACLVRAQPGGPLADVGGAMVAAATELNVEARDNPGGPANIALGYLLGAARAGAEDTGGIHTDLIRRLEAAARLSPGGAPLPPEFSAALAEGIAAGGDHG